MKQKSCISDREETRTTRWAPNKEISSTPTIGGSILSPNQVGVYLGVVKKGEEIIKKHGHYRHDYQKGENKCVVINCFNIKEEESADRLV